ncbi:MAG: lipoyl(octanoyl) transferase LipB, partial [Bdellovibrionales bacterium]|nr:lipoyl(octanoyl) transferase LipB [Bdellovibrionales bacterium]
MIEYIDLGLIPYSEALNFQMECVSSVQQGGGDRVIFCSHSPVVTLGRGFKGKDQEIGTWKGEVVETSRGGKATYHGPSQIVIYPIVNLANERSGYRSKDVHEYLRQFEKTIVQTLNDFDVSAEIKETPKGSDRQFTGVWVGNHKVASIGVAIKKWVTFHGCAINLEKDPHAFQGINPCGFSPQTMISVEEIIGKPIDRDLFKNRFKEY